MTAAEINAFLADLTSFERDVAPTPPPSLDWAELAAVVEWHGLGAIVSYQLDYRFLARVRPPAWLRERLLMTFNGFVNDNVLKVTQLRRLLSGDGMPATVLLGGAALADALYPHLAFRPLQEIDVWVRATDLLLAGTALGEGGLLPSAQGTSSSARTVAARFANPDIGLQLWRAPAGLSLGEATASALWDRKLPVPAYGPNAFRLAPADALCAHVAALSLSGFAVPRVLLVDLREMVLRTDGEGFYGPGDRVLASADLKVRAKEFGLSRALWAGLQIVSGLFPESAAKAAVLMPELPAQVRSLVFEAVVRPAFDPHRTKVVRALQPLRRILLKTGR